MKNKRKKRSFRDFLSPMFAIIALGILFYPIVANLLVSHKTSEVVSTFTTKRSQLSQGEISQQLQLAKEYNTYIYDMSQKISYNKSIPNYDKALKIDASGMIGYVSIPQIKVSDIPIYHGDSERTLSVGIGHLPQTSLPIGGKNTHAVLSAHSGRANNTLFTNLDKLKIGDVFYVTTLNLKLKYKITQTKVVLPEDVSSLGIHKGKDEVTLVTCYPTGINDHRLLVTGKRIPYTEQTPTEKIQRNQYGYNFWIILLSIVLALIASAYMGYQWINYQKRKKEKKGKEAESIIENDEK
ncbi:class C sortase [Lactococcus nasutitermitis]|uniref:Class C sortase n=1 Tax=Lactococcus nasutitermitis TaxID=1652957 RepID=A0ABV9JCE0_9LACT|nr:class C sortase [Lactococcus nasutitermitis]